MDRKIVAKTILVAPAGQPRYKGNMAKYPADCPVFEYPGCSEPLIGVPEKNSSYFDVDLMEIGPGISLFDSAGNLYGVFRSTPSGFTRPLDWVTPKTRAARKLVAWARG